MRVVIVSQYYRPERALIPSTLAEGLLARGHEVRVLTSFPNYPFGRIYEGFERKRRHVERLNGVLVRRVPMYLDHSSRPLRRMLNYATFAVSSGLAGRFVRGADVIYIYAPQMTPAVGPLWWRRTRRIPYVVHVQDLWPESITGSSLVSTGSAKRIIDRALNPWLRSVYRNAAFVVAIAPAMARMLIDRGAPSDRVREVMNWADETAVEDGHHPGRETSELTSVPVTCTVLYAGNLGDMQDLDTVIEAAARVRHLPGFSLEIVGDGVARHRLESRAQELGADNVTFVGRVEPSALPEFYRRSDFQIIPLKDLPIFRGTIPSKLQASLFSGVPVITTVLGDVENIVSANGLGLTALPENVESIAAAFEQAHRTRADERAAMSQRAHAYYAENLSQERGIDSIESLLREAAASVARKRKASLS